MSFGHDDLWRQHASCRDLPGELWFPTRAPGRVNRGEDAKAVCAYCPVLEDCLGSALANREESGIWGGAGEPTRRVLARLARLAPHPPVRQLGCRCSFCEAVAEHVRVLRAAFDRDGEVRHGRWEAFVVAGCRCTPCTVANTEHRVLLEDREAG